jgi:hypothetical protein
LTAVFLDDGAEKEKVLLLRESDVADASPDGDGSKVRLRVGELLRVRESIADVLDMLVNGVDPEIDTKKQRTCDTVIELVQTAYNLLQYAGPATWPDRRDQAMSKMQDGLASLRHWRDDA